MRASVMSRIAHCPHGSTNDPRPKGGLASRSLLAVDLVERSRDLDALRATKVGMSVFHTQHTCTTHNPTSTRISHFFFLTPVVTTKWAKKAGDHFFIPTRELGLFYLKWDRFLLDIVISIFSRIYLD
jgi:hypothetical protein